MKFVSKEHEEFFCKTVKEYQASGGTIDCYSLPVIYLLGLCNDTRENFQSLFSVKERRIKLSGFHAGWQTGTSYKICRLAFNLWNGFCYKIEDGNNHESVDGDYTVDEIFCCEYAEYFFEAIRLRFPAFCQI